MLITAIENFVFLGSLLAIVCFAVARAGKLLAERGSWNPLPHTLTRLYGAAIIMPPIVATWVVAAAIVPEWWLGETVFNSAHSGPVHDLHLLSEVTAALETALAYMTLAFIVAATGFAAWSSWRGYVRVGQIVKKLDMNAEPPSLTQVAILKEYAACYRLDVGLVMSTYPLSFVWGFLRSKLILSTGLLSALTAAELRGVLEHEVAHHQRRDNLMKLVLSLCCYASLAFPLSRLLLTWLTVEVEKICDEVAVSRTQAPLEIANALIKVRRRTSVSPVIIQSGASSLLSVDKTTFERRVLRLMGFVDTPVASANKSNFTTVRTSTVMTLIMVFSSSLIAVTLFSPLAVHRGVEFLIHTLR